MERGKFLFMGLVMICGLLSFTSCEEVEKSGSEDIPVIDKIEFTRVQEIANSNINNLGEKLIKSVIINNEDLDDASFSPVSASICLALVANSADSELEDFVVGLHGESDLPSLTATCKLLMQYLPSKNNKNIIAFANSVWVNDNYDVLSSWEEAIKNDLYSENFKIDFSNSSNKDFIDRWCSDKTNGLIPKLELELDDTQMAIFANAIYFMGEWEEKFNKNNTDMMPFYGRRNTHDVATMHDTRICEYIKSDNFASITLNIGNNDFIMVLPDENTDVESVIKDLDWKTIYNNSQNYLVDLSIPKFTISRNLKLTETLKSIGMPEKISMKKMGLEHKNYIKVQQTSFTSLDEDGVEVAVVTYTGMETANHPGYVEGKTEFKVNRPFIYMLRNKTTNSIIMAGAVRDIK